METLILVESPNKAKLIPGYAASAGLIARCLPTVGHLLDLPVNELAVDRKTYEATAWVPKDARAKEHFEKLRIAILKAPLVLVATDGDREGEGIAAAVWHLIPVGKGRRVIFEEITPGGVAAGLKKQAPSLKWGLVEAFLARRLFDRLFGYLASELVQRHFPGEKVSAGLVQSPALRLVVERWREAQAFQASPFFKVRAQLRHTAPDGTSREFLADVLQDGQTMTYPSRLEAESVRLPGVATCTQAEGREKSQKPRPPFTASAWLQTAQKVLGYGVDKGDRSKQDLYVEGRTTYPRTDSVRVAAEAIAYARQELASRFGPQFVPPQPVEHKDKAGVQGAHEALRPTVHVVCPACGAHMAQAGPGNPWVCDCGKTLDPALETIHYHGAGPGEESLPDGSVKPPTAWSEAFSLIEARFLASQAAPRRVRETVLTFDAEGVTLRTTGEVELFPGWRRVLQTDAAEQEDTATGPQAEAEDEAEEAGGPLPPVQQGDRVEILGLEVKRGMPKAPALFTQASLVAELERKGLGRPSTFREMVSVLLTKAYVLEQLPGKKGNARKPPIPVLVPSDLGGRLGDFLVKVFTAFMDYGFRVGMEKGLDLVESGELQRKAFLAELDKRLQACLVAGAALPVLHQARKEFGPCPKCDAEGRAGRLVHKRARRADGSAFEFAGCSLDTKEARPCGHHQQMMNGELVAGLPCPTCRAAMRLVTRKDGGLSWHCIEHVWHLADGKGQLVTPPVCPTCKNAMKHNHQKHDETKFFWGCFDCKEFRDADVWGKVLPLKSKPTGGIRPKPGPARAGAKG